LATVEKEGMGQLALRDGPYTRGEKRELLDYCQLTVRRGPRKGEREANVRPVVRKRLERLGRERALLYKTLVLTGLRKCELASLTTAPTT
jgi:hypothetical protein